VACLGVDYFVDAFKCSGADFNEDASHLAPDAVLHICIRSKSSDVEIDYLNSMIIAQGDVTLNVIENDIIEFTAIASREYVQDGVLVSTRVPFQFDYKSVGAFVKIRGGIVFKDRAAGAKLNTVEAIEEASFELDVHLQQEEIPKPPTSQVPGSSQGAAPQGPTPGTVPQGFSPGTAPISSSSVSNGGTFSPPTPLPKWYPNWAGESHECLNDGFHPRYMNDNPDYFMSDTFGECCEKHFALIDHCLVAGSALFQQAARPITNPTTSPPSASPSTKPTEPKIEFSCPPGLSGKYCLQTNGAKKTYRKREYYAVSLVWGMMPTRSNPNVWVIRDNVEKYEKEALPNNVLEDSYIDPSEPQIQEWLLKFATLARNETSLLIHPQLTWIEAVRDFAVENGFGFPVRRDLFIGLVELMKSSSFFKKLVEKEIATKSPGIAGEFLFTSVSVLSEVPPDYTSEMALQKWTNFTQKINDLLPESLPPVNVQGDVFLDSLRTSAIVDSTVNSYIFANGLYFVVILIFTGNFLLTLMVMISLMLILSCFAGLIFFAFQIDFGPVESLGVSIFVGLSANYLLHTAHAYHKSNFKERDAKIQQAVFLTGSPILWSALSTIGGSTFLFACRTWLLTELGILIVSIISLSLIFSVGFLLALLAFMGPLPLSSDDDANNLHTCDLMTIFKMCRFRKSAQSSESDQAIESVESQQHSDKASF